VCGNFAMEAWTPRVSGRLRREGGACGEGRRWPRPKCSGVDGESAGVDGDGTGVEGAVRKPLSGGAEAVVCSVIGEESKDGQSRKWRGVEVLRLMGNIKQKKLWSWGHGTRERSTYGLGNPRQCPPECHV